MRFTFAQLEAFFWVARLGKFQEAARQLNLAQPSISLRVHSLEEALGVKLFERLGRSVRLTSEGELLLELSSSLLAEAQRIHDRIGTGETVEGLMRFGLPENFATACLPELLRVLRRDHPRLRLDLAIGISDGLTRDLEEHRIDAAILSNPAASRRLRFVSIGEHRMAWVMAPSFGLKSPIRASDIRGIPIISNPAPAPQHEMIMDWFRSQDLAPLHLSSCTSVVVTAHLVAAGVGLSLLPVSVVQPYVDAGSVEILAARPEPAPVRLFFSYPASEGGPKVHAVLSAVRSVVADLQFVEPG